MSELGRCGRPSLRIPVSSGPGLVTYYTLMQNKQLTPKFNQQVILFSLLFVQQDKQSNVLCKIITSIFQLRHGSHHR